MKLSVCVLPGDGIGPEITAVAQKVLEAVCRRFGHDLETPQALIGGAAIDATGVPLPPETVAACQASQAVLLGAVGGPKWDDMEPALRPEKGLLGIRKALGLFANLRPATLFPELASSSLLRADIAASGVDVLVVRELTGGVYFGEPRGETVVDGGERAAFNTMIYRESEIARILRVAFEAARTRRRRVCSVDKANVLEVSRLWREVAERVAHEYPDVELSHMYVDNAAMQLVRCPSQFDVLVTENLFGDILSDEAAAITGSLGMLPSASLGAHPPGLFEPIHGSAPDIAGKDLANPLATVLSVAMMLRHGFGLEHEAACVENAVRTVLARGLRTRDIATEGTQVVGCSAMGKAVLAALEAGSPRG